MFCRFKENVRQRSFLLRDQPETPLNRSLYWVEYVLRHRGAYHLQSPAKDLNYFQYFMLDVLLLISVSFYLTLTAIRVIFAVCRTSVSDCLFHEKVKTQWKFVFFKSKRACELNTCINYVYIFFINVVHCS